MRADRDSFFALMQAFPAAFLYTENGIVTASNPVAEELFTGAAGKPAAVLLGEPACAAFTCAPVCGEIEIAVKGLYYSMHTGRFGHGFVVLLCRKEDSAGPLPPEAATGSVIRDALSGILMPLELLRPLADAGADEPLGMISKNVCLLLRLVTSFELLSPDALFLPEPGDLGSCIAETVAAAKIYAGSAGLTLRFRIPGKRIQAVFDRQLMERTLYRLVTNAVVHHGASELTLMLSATPSGVVLSASDNGSGAGAGSKPSGIVMACIRRAAQLHGGTVFIEDKNGRGSTVSLSMDRHPAVARRGAADLTCGFDSGLVVFSVFLPASF